MSAAHRGLAAELERSAGRRTTTTDVAIAATGLVLAAAVLAGGGADDGRLAWVGGAAVVLAAAGAVVLPRPALGRSGTALLVALAAWVAWSGVSVAWSFEPARSWDVFNRGVAYLAFTALGLLVGAVARRGASLAAGGLAALFALATLWALAGKVVPALGPELERSARLQAPVGYWNALALLLAFALPLWLWAGTRGRRERGVAAALVALGVVALALTASRGGILVSAAALAVWFALVPERAGSGRLLLAGGLPGAAVALWALTRPGLVEPGTLERAADGAVLGVLLAGAAAVAVLLAERLPAVPPRLLAAGAAAVFLAGAGTVLIGAGGPGGAADRFCAGGAETNEPARFGTVSSNNRCTWWREAGELWSDHRVVGTGAGSFEVARTPIRRGSASPQEPHSLPLRALAETGLVGFALLVAVVGAAALVATGALRRLGGGERLAAAALVAGAVAYLVHSLFDMGFEFVAVSAPVAFALGVLASAGRGVGVRRGVLGTAALAVFALALLLSLGSPRLADSRVEASVAALYDDGDAARAERLARQARSLNPLAVQPLFWEAAARSAQDDVDGARRALEQAVELQPHNSETWYRLGLFEYEHGRPDVALRYLDRSWGLDPYGPAQHLLEQVREAATRGG